MSESPTIPRTFRLQGHYLSDDARVITVARGSRDIVIHTPTPIIAPPIDERSTNAKPRILRYMSVKHPYLVFVPKFEPWEGPLFDVLQYTWYGFPITEREDGQWELKQEVAETWHNLETCLRVVGAQILEIVGIDAPEFSTFLSPGHFRTLGWTYKTEYDARRAALIGRTNFLPLIGLISMALWYLEHRSVDPETPSTISSNAIEDLRPWREQVIEKTKVRGQWLDMLAISLAADWTFERVGGLYRVGTLDNGSAFEVTGMELLVSTILRSDARIPLYVVWEHLPKSIDYRPQAPPHLQHFVPTAHDLQLLEKLPGAVKFRAFERDPSDTSRWRPIQDSEPQPTPVLADDTSMDIDRPSAQPAPAICLPDPPPPSRPPTPPGEFPPVVRFSGQKQGQSIDEFFERRAQSNAKRLANEPHRNRQSRLAKEKNAERQSCPGSKGSRVYVWEKIDGHWIRRPAGQEKEDLWFDHSRSQRRYDGFHDEWDLCVKWGAEGDDPMSDVDDLHEFLQDAGDLYPVAMVSGSSYGTVEPPADLLGASKDTVKKTLSPYQPARVGDPDYDPVYEPITTDEPFLQKSMYYRFGLIGERHWRHPPLQPSANTVQNLVGLPTAEITPVMQIFFGQCMDPEAKHIGVVDKKLIDFHRNPVYAQPENRFFDVFYTELWNQHELDKKTTAWNMLDEPRVNYYVISERDKPLVDSRVLLVASPTDLFEILRQRWGPSIDNVVERLVYRGMSFRLALVSTTIHHISEPSSRRRPVVDVYGGLGFRHEGYAPDMDDYFSYEMQRNFQFLHTSRGYLALQYGGLMSRLARPEVNLNDLLRSLDNGVPEFADCLWDRQSDHAYWFQSVSPREVELLCGVYHIATGNIGRKRGGTLTVLKNPGGSYDQTRKISWWPTPAAWITGGLAPGWWSPACEDWYLRKREQYESGKSTNLSTTVQWKSNVKFDKHLKVTLEAHEKISATMFQQVFGPSSFSC